MMCGGLNEEQPANDRIREIVKKHHQEVETKFGRKLERLEPVKYRSQIVAGTNYFIKCHIGDNDYIHLRVYERLPCDGSTTELSAVHPQLKKLEDPLEHFQ